MPNKITYTITTSDGKSHQVDEQNINKYGMQSYADAYKGATIRMRDKDGADYDIPLNRFTQARGQGLRPFRFEHRGTATTQAGSHAQQVVDEYDESVRRTQPRMTVAQKAKMSNWASSFGQNVGQATRQATQALKRQNDARKNNALRVRRENVGVDAAPYKLGENPNVVETGSTYNPQNGKVEKTYLTEAGNEYVGRDVADLEQNIIDDQKARELDPVNTALRDAYAERDRLDEAMRQRMQEIDDDNKGVGSILRELAEASKQPGSLNPLQQYQTDEQYRQLEAAARKNRATIQTLEDKRDNKMNDFFHSIATTAANGYTFNDGLAEINDAIALLDARKHINSINRKQTTGEPLTEEEQAAASVLAADAVNAEVQGQYAGDYGAWATAGQMVPTSIDLMKDIMLTPGASGVAKGVAGKVAGIGTRFLAKQAGETAAKSAAKAIGRGVLKGTGILLGAHTAGAVVSNTAGINRTAGLYGANVAGQTVKDAEGNYKVQDSMDVLDAFVDAERNQIRETGSEMFGEFLPGAGGLIKKGLEKIGLSKISNALTNIGNKQWYQQYNRLLTAGGYNGIPGEALEEYEGMAFDALTGNAGETWQQLKDPRTHVDIWLGTAAMSALLGAAPVTIQGAHTAMYYRYKHSTDKADRTAAYRFGDNEKWNGLKDVIDNTPNEDMANAVMDIMNDSSLYPEQKTAALNYVRNLTKMRGYNIGQMSNANEESEESKAANESYANGYNTENPEELNQIKNRYEVAREKALQAFPQETLDEIENDNSLLVQYAEAPTLRKIVVDYLNTKQAYDGMIQRVRDDIDTQVQQSNDMIDSRINKTTGMIQPAMMKAPDENGNERRAYVISGNVEMLADMSGVDREKSDGSILVRYADTGEMEMVSPSAIMRVDDAISPEQEQQESETNITQTYAQQKANEIDGKVAFAQGDVYTLTDEAGKVAQVTVVPNKDGIVDNGDGTVNVDAGTGEVVAMPKDAIQIMIDRTNKNKVVPQEEPAAAVTYNLNDDVYVQDENGNIVHGVITGDVNEDGQYEVQTDTPVKNVLVNLYIPDQFVQQPQATTTEQPAAEQTPAEQATEQQPANEQQAEQTQTEIAQEEQKPAIPTDEKGNMLYHQVPVETTINDLFDGKLDDNEIRDFVDANISEADKNLEKVNKKAPKIGTNKAEYLKKKQEWQKQVEDATRIRDYWNSVNDYIAQQTHTTPEEVKAAQDELSGKAARREYQDMGGSVQQDAVRVASDFIRGAKITPESFKAETGYGTDEQRKFVGMIAKAENGGKTIDRLAEELVSYDNAEMNGVLFGGDTSSAKDAILSALQGAGTRGELKQTNEAEEQAYIDARNAARDAQYMEQYGMTYEEYLAYEEQIMPTIWREYNNYDEVAFNNMYAEEIEQLIKSRENDTTGEEQADGRGNQVLSEQQVTEQRGSADGTEPGTEVQAGVQGIDENAAAPEEAQQQAVAQKIATAEAETDTNPTEGQKEAGNYKKGHVRIDGYDITIEQPKGSVRRGTDADGKQWEQTMNNTYGYIRGTEGVDGDHIDIFLSDNPTEGNVYVVDQVNPDGSFDEHKVMYGFQSAEDARAAYLSNYEEGWQGLGTITEVSKDEFKKWVNSSKRKTKAFAEYKSVNAIGAQNEERVNQRELPIGVELKVFGSGSAAFSAKVYKDKVLTTELKEGDKFIDPSYARWTLIKHVPEMGKYAYVAKMSTRRDEPIIELDKSFGDGPVKVYVLYSSKFYKPEYVQKKDETTLSDKAEAVEKNITPSDLGFENRVNRYSDLGEKQSVESITTDKGVKLSVTQYENGSVKRVEKGKSYIEQAYDKNDNPIGDPIFDIPVGTNPLSEFVKSDAKGLYISDKDILNAFKKYEVDAAAEKPQIKEGESPIEYAKRVNDWIEGKNETKKNQENVNDLLKEDEINGSSFPQEIKDGALSYLKGNVNFATSIAYQQIYNYVRNTTENNKTDSGTGNEAQLAVTDDENGRRGSRQSGGETEPMGSEPQQGQNGLQDSEGSNILPNGTAGNTEVHTTESKSDRVPTGSTKRGGGSGTGSKRSNVRKPGTERNVKTDTPRDTGRKDTNSERDEIIGEINSLLDDFVKAGKEDLSLSVIGMNAKQIEIAGKLLVAGVRLGYTYIKDGITKFNDWKDTMRNKLAVPFSNAMKLTNAEIDEFINDMWEYPYTINNETKLLKDWAAIMEGEKLRKEVRSSLEEKRKVQLDAEDIPVKVGDMDNIKETLPYLLPQQHKDVQRAEVQFFDPSHNDRDHAFGKGYLFTNGTGTGKTYTGLGIVKRFIKQGKKRILILTPSQTKVSDWVSDAKNLNIELTPLESTKDKGEGAVITTFANLRTNKALMEDDFDLVVYDESHRIMENKSGEETAGARQHYMLTNKNVDTALRRLESIHPLWIEENKLRERMGDLDKMVAVPDMMDEEYFKKKEEIEDIEKRLEEIRKEQEKVIPELKKKAEEAVKKTKVVFLSATPFNTIPSLDYAEGYIFSYPEENKNTVGSYNHRSPKEEFLEQHFGAGYRFRYGRIESHIENSESLSQQEVQFSDYLENTLQTKSGRIIDSEYDYSRDFPTVTFDMAPLFNGALNDVYDYEKDNFGELREAFRDVFYDYNYSTALFETMKISAIIPRIKKHLDMGRKVVVFHRRVSSQNKIEPPFHLALSIATSIANSIDQNTKEGKEKRRLMLKQISDFKKKYSKLLEYELKLDYSMPREQLAKEFGRNNVLFFSGNETKKEKNNAVKMFNDDDSGKNIIIIQEASGKEGISLHDTTGKHQRVLITLALPQSPITALQIEGRIYRIGNKSNAIFEYPLLGLNLETTIFGSKFNNQVSTTENLALGSNARNLRDSFAEGVIQRSGDVSLENQGVGGKDFDNAGKQQLDNFDKSVLDYYGTQKLKGGRKERAGIDYFPTPEPIGYKMVDWAMLQEGEDALEPSAGHGAIARYVPATNGLTAIEPSSELFPILQLRAGGSGRKFINQTFEMLNQVNKFDVVLMNPPYGSAGSTALNHVKKAFDHLNEGGRLIAIIPEGSATKKFDKWFEETPAACFVGEVKLPAVTFNRAGTSVMTRIIVVDKVSREETRKKLPYFKSVDLRYVDNIDGEDGLFESIRNVSMPRRTIDEVAIDMKNAKKTSKDFKDIKGIDTVDIDDEGISIRGRYPMIMDESWDSLKSPETYARYNRLYQNSRKEDKKDFYGTILKTIRNILGKTEEEILKASPVKQSMYNFSIGENTRTGETMYLAVPTAKGSLSNDEYRKISNIASNRGGYWSRFKKAFNFNTEEDAKGFISDVDEYMNNKEQQGTQENDDNVLYREANTNINEEEANDLYREVTDERLINKLENEPKVKVYRAMQLQDGKLLPPMSGKIKTIVKDKNGKERTKWVWREPTNIGKWEEAEERPDLANDDGTFTLNKGNNSLNAAYNPYIHTSRSPINDQFSSAWNRDELVTVEVEVPVSELTSGYRAEKAKDSVGEVEWKSGPVGRQLAKIGKPRLVILSRWDKPIRVIPVDEVAGEYAKRLEGTGIEVPFNTVTPELREALVKAGVKIGAPENNNAGKASLDAYNEWRNNNEIDRQGAGALTDSELSNANDPAGKMLGKPSRTPAQQKAFAERERQRMADRAREVADILHLDNVEIVTDASTLQGRRAKAKGFYSRDNGKIVIVVPNHVDMADIEQTALHEAVAHYGLRKLFGSNFDTFINNVYNNADENVRREIVQLAAKHNWDFATATEEYLASLAENTNFEDMNASWWNKIKDLFLSMVRSIGLKGFSGKTLSDNELRYILWRSYENLKNPGRYRNVFSEAEDIAKQNELKVGNYAVRETRESVADNDLYREVEPEERRRVYVADIYDARIKNGMYQMREAVQDSMLSLREAMTEILKAEGNKNVKIEDIAGFENAYLGENRLSSVNKAEADAFANLLFKPLLEEAANLSGSEKGGRDELVNYMMAKHGLERNKVMAERDAKNEYDNYVKEHPKGEKTLDDFVEKYRKRDYAGLNALTGKEKVAEAEAEAQQMVDDYEAEHDTEELWNKTRAVSNAILDKEYDTGLMSKETMEKLKSMFDFYIPLRGFDEKTSEDEYAYLENKNSAFFAPIKAAKGRKSKADDPFAYLQGMAENAIMQGNRNKLVKQKFLNFVLNHQSDLASVSDLWLKYNEVNDEWEPVFPDNIKDTDTAKEVERKMQEFEERMQQLAEEEPELYKHGKQTVEVPYRVVESRDLKQHQILVRRNGRNYVITINGNPRAAQAVNGLTNPDNDMSGAIGAILKAGQNLNRQLSAFYTTRNPDFVVSNFIRDALYANSMAWVKERPNYALRFHKNYVLANPIKMKKLFARYRKNKLKANSKTDMMFKQFMLNGGETGYASVRDIEKRKNEISKEIKKYQGKLPIKKAWGYLAERFDEFNRAVENSARFAAFVTSREMGRSIERSIYDAKEISVNFNKKGSGSKFMGATGQTKLGNAGAFISGLGRSGFVFWNAAIQGSTNFGRQVKRNPAKALTAMATMFMLGAVVASLGYGDDDDDDKNSYWNLPDYVRRSNIMFRAGDQWVSIPLPVEYRSLYGLGELMISTMSDKEHLSGEEIANQIAGQISQVMPIDILEGGGGAKAFVPSFIKPFAEAYGYNRSWTGMPIYKDTDFNKDLPEWTKAYKSANKYLVDLSETLNEATGGDKYTKGEIDINPAKIEHVLTGYFGGIANTIDRLTKMGETAIGQREYDPNSILIWNRIVKNGDERTEYKAINNEYFRIKKEHDTLKKRLNNYERDTDNGVFDYAEKIDFLYNSPEYRRLEIYEEYQPDIEDLIIMLDETNDADEQRDIEAQINELKKMMISDINKYARK